MPHATIFRRPPTPLVLRAGLQRQVVYGGLRIGLYEPIRNAMVGCLGQSHCCRLVGFYFPDGNFVRIEPATANSRFTSRCTRQGTRGRLPLQVVAAAQLLVPPFASTSCPAPLHR